MAPELEELLPEVEEGADPYHLTPGGIKEPPKGWGPSLRYLGPGLILSASIVGSGELIATTALGAQAGFAILWMVIFSTLVKVAVQVELARWTISTGEPALTGYNKVPPKIGPVGWINVLWFVMALSKFLQIGGIVGGVAVAFSVLFPIGGDPLGFTSILIWTVIVVVGSIALLYSNRYGLIERGAIVLAVTFTAITVVIALGLPLTPFAYGTDDLLGGLTFSIPAGTLGAAIAMFGITGVGADVITFYTYWCVEKGYARWAGPNGGSEAWARRDGRGPGEERPALFAGLPRRDARRGARAPHARLRPIGARAGLPRHAGPHGPPAGDGDRPRGDRRGGDARARRREAAAGAPHDPAPPVHLQPGDAGGLRGRPGRGPGGGPFPVGGHAARSRR